MVRRTGAVAGVNFDGRQRQSIGLTQPELAAYMQRLGSHEAMAFDNGGSVTMVGRLPGRPTPIVLNSPSDGRERPIADALLVFSLRTRSRGIEEQSPAFPTSVLRDSIPPRHFPEGREALVLTRQVRLTKPTQ